MNNYFDDSVADITFAKETSCVMMKDRKTGELVDYAFLNAIWHCKADRYKVASDLVSKNKYKHNFINL